MLSRPGITSLNSRAGEMILLFIPTPTLRLTVTIGSQIVILDEALINWRSFKEKCLSLSTMESEFIAITEAVKNQVWFDRIRRE